MKKHTDLICFCVGFLFSTSVLANQYSTPNQDDDKTLSSQADDRISIQESKSKSQVNNKSDFYLKKKEDYVKFVLKMYGAMLPGKYESDAAFNERMSNYRLPTINFEGTIGVPYEWSWNVQYNPNTESLIVSASSTMQLSDTSKKNGYSGYEELSYPLINLMSYSIDEGKYVGQNAYGVKKVIEKKKIYNYLMFMLNKDVDLRFIIENILPKDAERIISKTGLRFRGSASLVKLDESLRSKEYDIYTPILYKKKHEDPTINSPYEFTHIKAAFAVDLHNLQIIDPQTKKVLAIRSFDF